MNWLLVGSVGGGVTVVHVESGGMTYSAAQKLADEINAMYAAQQSAQPTVLDVTCDFPGCEELGIIWVCANHATPSR